MKFILRWSEKGVPFQKYSDDLDSLRKEYQLLIAYINENKRLFDYVSLELLSTINEYVLIPDVNKPVIPQPCISTHQTILPI